MMHDSPLDRTAYDTFAAAAQAAGPAYRRVMRGHVEPLEINAAERFARAFVARLFDQPQAPLRGQADQVVTAAHATRGLDGLGLVAAALLAMRTQRFAEAADLAERAYANDQHETFAQRLFLAAGEASPSLRLAVDDWLEDRFCPNPFTDAEVIGSGDVYTCCAAWLPARIGSARDPARPDYWRGERAAELRRSILDGDFGHCSRLSCPRIATRSLPRKSDVTDPALRAQIDSDGRAPLAAPNRVLLSYDTSCNLSCPSCRTSRLALDQAGARSLNAFYDDRIAPLLAGARHIKITGSGDPFGSRHFRHVIARLTAEPAGVARLQLHTNGVLLDTRAWTDLKLEGHVQSVWVSVDAACADTYAVLRRGGSFARLVRNLEGLGQLRAEGRIGQFRLDFVVQAENFREMPAFVALARQVGADGVHFLMLRNWGTFSEAEYQARAICAPGHPDHPALLAVLADPVFAGPGVDLGNLAPLRAAPRRPRPAPAALPPMIVVLGVPRTGSNHLATLMSGFDSILMLREIFNPAGAYGLDDEAARPRRRIEQQAGTSFDSETDPALVAHLAADPASALAALREAAGTRALAFKIFPGHLPEDRMVTDILATTGALPVFLTRALLPCFISYRKAQVLGRWQWQDTTRLKISADLQDYLDWRKETLGWYRRIASALTASGRRFGRIDYADFSACPPVAAAARIAGCLAPLGFAPGPFATPRSIPFRQDRNPDPFDRLAHGDAFRDALASAGLLEDALRPSPGFATATSGNILTEAGF